MAFFGVTVNKIATVANHANADRLDVATLEGVGFSFVTRRDEFRVGDTVVYFPIDSLLPAPLVEKLGLTGKLAGKDKNRVKTIRLRGTLSQGLVMGAEAAEQYTNTAVAQLALLSDSVLDTGSGTTTNELTKLFGVEKYEPEVIPCKSGNLVALPSGLGVYDIEGCERYQEALAKLMAVPVSISEKLEGQNFSVLFNGETDRFYVNQRKFSIEEIAGLEHDFWRIARELDLENKCRALLSSPRFAGCSSVALYGEYVGPGVQNNIYGLKRNTVYFYDIRWVVGQQLSYSNPNEALCLFAELGLTTVPQLANDVMLRYWLGGKTIVQASNGPSALKPSQLREGIVIKPMCEEYDASLGGRLILKQRDPVYLAEQE